MAEKEAPFYRKHPGDKIYWIIREKYDGPLEISFDQKKIYNLFTDYPDKMTPEEVELFNKENPSWADLLNSKPKKEEE